MKILGNLTYLNRSSLHCIKRSICETTKGITAVELLLMLDSMHEIDGDLLEARQISLDHRTLFHNTNNSI